MLSLGLEAEGLIIGILLLLASGKAAVVELEHISPIIATTFCAAKRLTISAVDFGSHLESACTMSIVSACSCFFANRAPFIAPFPLNAAGPVSGSIKPT